MSEPIEWICRVIGAFMAFVGLYGLVVFLPAILNFKSEDDDRNF